MPKQLWKEMTSTEIDRADTSNWIAILPIAAIEQHGPHLPISTDTCIAEGMISRVLEVMSPEIPATFLPVQAIGKSNEHDASPGTLTFSWKNSVNSWLEIGKSVHRSGVKKIILISSHGGNVPIIDIVCRELRIQFDMLAVGTTWARFGQPTGLYSDRETAIGIHGGEIETSIMLHLRPDLVNMELAENFNSLQEKLIEEYHHLRAYGQHQFGWKAQDLNPQGVVGNAAQATAEKGYASIDHAASGFVKLLEDVNKFNVRNLWTP